jgi:hypothetical protein
MEVGSWIRAVWRSIEVAHDIVGAVAQVGLGANNRRPQCPQ